MSAAVIPLQAGLPVNVRERDKDFLPAALEVLETPPSRTARMLATAIAAIFVIALCWTWWGKIDVVLVAQGRIAPASHVKTVHATSIATVTAINVVEGQNVTVGDVLVELNDSVQEAELTAAEQGALSTRLDIARIEAELAALDGEDPAIEWAEPIPTAMFVLQQKRLDANVGSFRGRQEALHLAHARARQEVLSLEANQEGLRAELAYTTERLNRAESLAERGLISSDELSQMRTQTEILRQKLIEADLAIEAQHLSLQQTDLDSRNLVLQARETLISALEEQFRRLTLLERDIARYRTELAATRIPAPVDGIVEKLTLHTVGGVVSPQIALMEIVPTGDQLEIEAMVSNQDTGYLELGQQATIKIDSFPFTTYGTFDGVVSRISQDSTATDAGYMFTVRIRLSDPSIAANPLPLRPGMTVAAEIKTADRRIISFFFDPITKHFQESLRER